MDTTAFTELDEKLSTFLSLLTYLLTHFFISNPSKYLYWMWRHVWIQAKVYNRAAIGFPVVLLDRKPKRILTLCWFFSLAPQSCDPWTGSLWVCLGVFFSHKRVTLQYGNSIKSIFVEKNAEWKNEFYKYINTIRILCCVFTALPTLKHPSGDIC